MVRTPYDADFVKALKTSISPVHRKWDPVDKLWKVDPSQDAVLIRIVTKFFGEPTVLEDKEIVVVAAEDSDPYAALLRLAPDDVLKKCYRLIASAIHPDKGGQAQSMTRANQAWSAIRADRGM